MSNTTNLAPIVSKIFCSSCPTVFVVRNRPHVVHGGGFVVSNGSQEVVFRVDGCGILGTRGELILRDGIGEPLLFIRRKGGIVQALSVYKQWKGYSIDYEGSEKLVFTMKEPTTCLVRYNAPTVTVVTEKHNRDWDFEIKGSFVERACSINDRRGNVAAQVMRMGEVELMASKEIYKVVVQPGFDQAFIFGVVAVLDNINHESTRC